MNPRHRPDRRAVADALIAGDPRRLKLAQTSASFRRGLDEVVEVAILAVAGLEAVAEKTDLEMAARVAAMKRGE